MAMVAKRLVFQYVSA